VDRAAIGGKIVETTDCVVIGAGVIGLAVARALSQAGREVIVAEAESAIGMGTSSRNSEVIHAGIYYPPGSLKARFCVEGKKRLYAYCAEHDVPHRRIGKLIVAATDDQTRNLDELKARAASNGVDDLRFLNRGEMNALEPDLKGAGALLSPSTGIVDSHAYMLALQGDAENAGAAIAFRTPIVGGRLLEEGVELRFGGEAPMELKARFVVNAAGLFAHRVLGAIDGLPPGAPPAASYAKGNYFALQGQCPFSRLIYPVPESGGLGVHLTLDMGGQARFGPDVQWIPDIQSIDNIDYSVDPARSEPFYAAIRTYWPDLPDGALHPDYSGIRVKLDGEASPDFRIDTSCGPSLVNLLGFESPGLTSSLAIGEHVANLAREIS
jgi:L-2-hydroxyglutarate oxidase LhgO